MDAYLTLVSKREIRNYTNEPVPMDSIVRMLEAGRATGSARNRQNWRFNVIRNREVLDALSDTMSAPRNLRGCNVAIAIAMTGRTAMIDSGRVAQNIMLAAWDEGIGTCPNTPMQEDAAKSILGLPDESFLPTVLSVGYPDEPLLPRTMDTDKILASIDRLPLDRLTTWVD